MFHCVFTFLNTCSFTCTVPGMCPWILTRVWIVLWHSASICHVISLYCSSWLATGSREIAKSQDMSVEMYERIWEETRHHCCRWVYQISEGYDKINTKSHRFVASQDLGVLSILRCRLINIDTTMINLWWDGLATVLSLSWESIPGKTVLTDIQTCPASTFPIVFIFPWSCVWGDCTITYCQLFYIDPGKAGFLVPLLMHSVWRMRIIGYIMA